MDILKSKCDIIAVLPSYVESKKPSWYYDSYSSGNILGQLNINIDTIILMKKMTGIILLTVKVFKDESIILGLLLNLITEYLSV